MHYLLRCPFEFLMNQSGFVSCSIFYFAPIFHFNISISILSIANRSPCHLNIFCSFFSLLFSLCRYDLLLIMTNPRDLIPNGRLIFGLFHFKCIISHINVHISNVKHTHTHTQWLYHSISKYVYSVLPFVFANILRFKL